jgi:hypothetical protein
MIKWYSYCLSQGDSYLLKFISGGSIMQMKKIKEIAKKKGVNAGKMGRIELVRAIQRAEGNSDCFATVHVNECNQINCLWRADCKAEVIAEADIPIVSTCI